jgi:small-conductance mechanosensitive channel
MSTVHHLEIFLIPLIILGVSILLGLILDKFILKKLLRFTEKTSWEGDEIIVKAMKGLIFWLTIITGTYFALTNTVNIPESYQSKAEKAIVVIAVLILTSMLSRIAVGFIRVYTSKGDGGDFPATSIFTNLTKFAVFILGLLFIFQHLGISITPMLTALGVGGLAVALALQDTLANLFAGLNVIAARRIKPGDFIMLETGQEGYVEDISWRSTVIRELPNNMIIIPNTKLSSSIIKNYHSPDKEIPVKIAVGVSYDSDLDHVEKVTLEVAKAFLKEHPGAVHDFEPVIRYNAFADSSINFNVILRAKEYSEQFPMIHEFIKKLHRRYKQESIEIPFPIRTVHMKNI